ncbi:hypothetical protein ABB37_08731 [Leptomonas pyrrhocoris]|uniref:RING-type domain-containing protein n=1 Tax=Leptomonas pyrrhocoris TaxID=157538 RepID=A0A0M9FSB2_LEPPY|nr:hypothetical protein ABB37_08731 [Leptomonas pyrrhocoris]KPA75045.1 hypothetical protein ABB37_08731 [Leptomonas pyrrhocoris]|eukprot:XP_015653484.1 hypothetical protein ABB37_08731 [Leptomonas pyrrhocoris]
MVTRRAVAAYIAASFVANVLFLADYANTYRAFYPTMVALANSSAFRLMMVNTVLAAMMLLWFAMQFVFFGKLNASEETALLTSFTIYLAECIVVPLYFNLTLMSSTMVFFAFTLVWRLLHKLAAERVTTLSTVQLTLFSISRMVAYLNVVLIGDVGLLLWLFQTRPDLRNEKASLHYSLLLIYMLLVTSSLRSAVRFGSLFVLRQRHTLLPFVADVITSIAESLLFVGVYAYIFMKSTLPLLLLRGFISHALRIFEKASGLAEFLVLARRVRHDMPDATADDLARDARCTICYEDMAPGSGTKRLPCGHCYHTECLEHWLEGHSTCPYCRANIMRMPSSDAAQATNGADGAPAGQPAAAAAAAHEEVEENGGVPADAAATPLRHLQPQQPPPEGSPTAAANVNEQQQQQQQRAEDPFSIRLRRFASPHTTATATIPEPVAAETQLRAAYQRYLNRVDPTRSANSPVDKAEERAEAASSPPHRLRSPPPTAQARNASCTTSPPRTASPSTEAVSNTPLRTSKTVDQLKLKAYKKYHRRLREAERKLAVALKQAEEHGSVA